MSHLPGQTPLLEDIAVDTFVYSSFGTVVMTLFQGFFTKCFQREIAVCMAGRRVEVCDLSRQGCYHAAESAWKHLAVAARYATTQVDRGGSASETLGATSTSTPLRHLWQPQGAVWTVEPEPGNGHAGSHWQGCWRT